MKPHFSLTSCFSLSRVNDLSQVEPEVIDKPMAASSPHVKSTRFHRACDPNNESVRRKEFTRGICLLSGTWVM